MNIGERIKKIRNEKKLTLVAFGKLIDMTDSNISRMEKGQRPVTDRTIKLICNEFSVNEEWLRTGEGGMFIQVSHDEKIMKLMTELAQSENKEVQDLFIALYSLNGEYFEIAKDIIFSLEKRSSKK